MKTNFIEAKNNQLIAFGDVHIGNINTDIHAFKKMLDYAKKTGAHLICLGDLCEAISYNFV